MVNIVYCDNSRMTHVILIIFISLEMRNFAHLRRNLLLSNNKYYAAHEILIIPILLKIQELWRISVVYYSSYANKWRL